MGGSKKNQHFWERIIVLMKPYWHLYIGVSICMVFVALFTILSPYLLGQIVDEGIVPHNIHAIILLSVMAFLASLLGEVCDLMQLILSQYIGRRIVDHMRIGLYRKLMHVPFAFFKQSNLGDIIARFNNDIGMLQNTIATSFINAIGFTIILLCTVAFMLILDPFFAIITFSMLVISSFLTRIIGNQGREMSAITQTEGAKLLTNLNETLNIQAILTIKSFGQQQSALEKYTEINQRYSRIRFHMTLMNQWFTKVLYVIGYLGNALVYLIGGLQVLSGHASIGQIITSAALLIQLYRPANQLALIWVDFQKALPIFERVFSVMDEQTEDELNELSEGMEIPAPLGHITLEQISFTYPDSTTPALQEISFSIAPGQVIAIVGASGSGKTTLSYILTRIYHQNLGRILLDGRDIRSIPRHQLTQIIGMMSQDPYLFHVSARENIAFGCIRASQEQLEQAARTAAIHDVIMHLPQGYDTILGERGYTLSGGERQRIAFARVILKDPRILILDEATSSLDSTSEGLIQEALEKLTSNRTTIVIAHRLSTIRHADQIIVLDKGRIVEQGTHKDLLRCNGIYHMLYEQQAK